MAGRHQTSNPATLKQQALRDLELSRIDLSHHLELASEEWRPQALVERSFKQHRWIWLAGASIAGGIILSRILRSSNEKNGRDIGAKSATNRTLTALIVNPLWDLGRKAAVAYLSKRIRDSLQRAQSGLTPAGHE